ncbi:MAG TPA: hypothetical protein VGO14_08285 [Solirubrobacteraceae bacterium]|nr:hypothetical protein [Solirubrobacteraceae bacterium]
MAVGSDAAATGESTGAVAAWFASVASSAGALSAAATGVEREASPVEAGV